MLLDLGMSTNMAAIISKRRSCYHVKDPFKHIITKPILISMTLKNVT